MTSAASADSFEAVAKLLWDAVTSGNYWAIAAALMCAAVFVARRALVKRIPWLGSDRGGVALALVGGTAFGVAVGLVGGAPMGVAAVMSAFKVALAAAGGFTALRKLVWPDKAQVWPSLRPAVYMPPVTPGGAPQAVDAEEPIKDRR